MKTPWLACPYRLRRSPHYDEIGEEFHDWFLSYTPFAQERRKQTVRATDYPYLAAVCWPASDRRRLWDIAAMAGAFTERDGEYDAHRYGASQPALLASAADTRGHYAAVREPRWGPLFADIWRRFTDHVPTPQLHRLAEVMAAFLDACIAYDEHLRARGPFASVADYLAVRRLSLGQLIDHVLVEVSLGIDLGELLDEPALARVVDADVERVAVYQDILSLRKDLAEGEDAENLVLVIARERRCSTSEALAAAGAIHAEKMARFEELVERLEEQPIGRVWSVCRFVAGLRDFTAGLIEWTSHSARYTLAEASAWHRTPFPATRQSAG